MYPPALRSHHPGEGVCSFYTIERSLHFRKKSMEDVAAARFEIISPLLDAALDPVLRIEKQKEVSWHCGKSYRTIGRWLKSYAAHGFTGLKPNKTRPKTNAALPGNYGERVEA